MAIKCQENWPNGHKIYRHLPLQDPPKFTQIGVWGLKIYHLATLVCRAEPSLPQKKIFRNTNESLLHSWRYWKHRQFV
jgi:hypothetical protein